MDASRDLISAAAIMGGFCILSAIFGALLTYRSNRRKVLIVQLVSLAALVGYVLLVWDRPILITLLPASAVIIFGNWLPLWACFFVGIYGSTSNGLGARQVVLSVLAICLSAFSVVSPMFGEAPKCGSVRSLLTFQYQTSPYTCSAACATTLLRLHGISATEQEMADLCLTRQGAHWMGVYRALKLKTAGTDWDVVVEPFDANRKPQLPTKPSLLALNFDPTSFPDALDHGFSRLTGHSVVSLGTEGPGYVDVFDPSPDYGFEKWGTAIWQATTHGVVLRLVDRDMKPHLLAEVQQRTRLARLLSHVASR